MTITFYSNFLNDHQLPLCLAFISIIGEDNFRFVAHEKIDPERIAMGFIDMNEVYPFVIKSYEGGSQQKKGQDLMLQSDIVIIGSYKNMPFEERMATNKLTFRYNERILKKGLIHWLDPRLQKMIYRQWGKYRNKNLFTLCASAYTATDLSLFGYPKSKCFKWGYFPTLKKYDDIDKLLETKKQGLRHHKGISVLWAGRLIDWKHPELPIMLAKKLKDSGEKFTLDIIGIGPMYAKLESMIAKFDLEDCVTLLGAMPPAEVRNHMEKSQIFLFTSDMNEGWGAVLNESLNSGCAVVANHSIGSVPFLLENEKSGLIYNNNFENAYSQVKKLFCDNDMIESLGRKGLETILDLWNAEIAAERFVVLANCLMSGKKSPFKTGPCSPV